MKTQEQVYSSSAILWEDRVYFVPRMLPNWKRIVSNWSFPERFFNTYVPKQVLRILIKKFTGLGALIIMKNITKSRFLAVGSVPDNPKLSLRKLAYRLGIN